MSGNGTIHVSVPDVEDAIVRLYERVYQLEKRCDELERAGEADRKREYLRHASLTRRLRELEHAVRACPECQRMLEAVK